MRAKEIAKEYGLEKYVYETKEEQCEFLDEFLEGFPKWWENFIFFHQLKEKALLKLLEKSPQYICFIKNPSIKEQLAAFKNERNMGLLSNVKKVAKRIQLLAVERYPDNIRYINNPDEEVQLASIKHTFGQHVIQYIKNPTKKAQIESVKRYGDSIRYIKNPSKTVQLHAVKQDGLAIKHINNPDDDIKLAAVKQTGWAIKEIKHPNLNIQLVAVKEKPHAIGFLDKPHEKTIFAAIKLELSTVFLVKNISENVQLFIAKNSNADEKYLNILTSEKAFRMLCQRLAVKRVMES